MPVALDPDDSSTAAAERDLSRLLDIMPFLRQLTITALTASYTQTVGLVLGASGLNQIDGGRLTDYRYDNLPHIEYLGAGDHALAHPEDGAFMGAGHRITRGVSTRDRVRVHRFFFDQLRQLLDGLQSIPYASGTLFDYTTVLCFSEYSGVHENSSNGQHSTSNLPYLLVGGDQTPFQTGQYLDLSGSNVNHGDYLLTLARALGSDVDRMGVGQREISEIVRDV